MTVMVSRHERQAYCHTHTHTHIQLISHTLALLYRVCVGSWLVHLNNKTVPALKCSSRWLLACVHVTAQSNYSVQQSSWLKKKRHAIRDRKLWEGGKRENGALKRKDLILVSNRHQENRREQSGRDSVCLYRI